MLLWLAVSLAATDRPMRDLLVINEDNSHFFGSRSPEQMNLAGLQAFIDQYAGTAVTHLFLSPNAMRASFESRSRDAIWAPVDGVEPTGRWPQNAKLLASRGLDPYAVWIARSRERGLSPWLSMRMNDLHSVDEPDNFMHSTFWRQHPELWRIPQGTAAPWSNRALNYAHAAVRDHQMAFVDELLERYDPDGLELDWMRFGYHLTPGRERQEASILTDFMRQVRQKTQAAAAGRGHPIRLAARVPAHPDAAAGLGMDGVLWAREGLVDLLVPCPFWTSSDFDIPVELWLERLGPASAVTIAPGLEYNARPWPGGAAVPNSVASARGFAASARWRGADSLYLFNWMDSDTRPVSASAYSRFLHEGLSLTAATSSPRRHPVCFRDTVPTGFPNGLALPRQLATGATWSIPIGPRPTAGPLAIVLGLSAPPPPGLKVTLNGLPTDPPEPVGDLHDLGGQPSHAVRFPCPLTAACDGHNTVALAPLAGAVGQVVWVEVRVGE